MAETCSQRSAEKQLFEWATSEVELLLERVKTYAADCMFEGKDLDGVKSKFDTILALYVERSKSKPNKTVHIAFNSQAFAQ